LQQYLNGLDFRYNHRKVSDSERTLLALKAAEGKRLTTTPTKGRFGLNSGKYSLQTVLFDPR